MLLWLLSGVLPYESLCLARPVRLWVVGGEGSSLGFAWGSFDRGSTGSQRVVEIPAALLAVSRRGRSRLPGLLLLLGCCALLWRVVEDGFSAMQDK